MRNSAERESPRQRAREREKSKKMKGTRGMSEKYGREINSETEMGGERGRARER